MRECWESNTSKYLSRIITIDSIGLSIMLPGGHCRNCGEQITQESLVTCQHCHRRYHAPCHAYHDEFECPGAEDGWIGSVEF